jgi:hypothetical protein
MNAVARKTFAREPDARFLFSFSPELPQHPPTPFHQTIVMTAHEPRPVSKDERLE